MYVVFFVLVCDSWEINELDHQNTETTLIPQFSQRIYLYLRSATPRDKRHVILNDVVTSVSVAVELKCSINLHQALIINGQKVNFD